jgi:membrane-associated phospholipid phosphatase
MQISRRRSRFARLATATALGTALLVGAPLAANAANAAPAPTFPSTTTPPDLISLLGGYDNLWTSSGTNNLHGTVKDAATLSLNDELAVWINNHASPAEQFKALQDSEYDNGGAYDQSVTISDSLGSVLGPLYVKGRENGSLPLTSALINSQTGTSGAYVSTGAAKAHFSYPRPYLPTDPAKAPVAGDDPLCLPTLENASSLLGIRTGKSYADATGNLAIKRVADVTDTTHEFSPNNVPLSAGYSTSGICKGGSYPSGHTTTAYQAGVTLATLLPELAPEILTRASEAGNDRIVLGVHYPLDIVGGRMDGEAALAARWSDTQYRTDVLEPARKELVSYLEAQCGGTLQDCIAKESSYSSDPYAGAAIPGGTAQIVTDRTSAVKVYQERLTYGFPKIGATNLAPSVPAGAENLLLTTFPTLTDAQRTAVLAQTEIASGFPLDQSGTAGGSWERLNLAAATSATVEVATDGTVTVTSTGGEANVILASTDPGTTDPATPAPSTGVDAPAPTAVQPHLPVVSG